MVKVIKELIAKRPALPGLSVVLFLFAVYIPNWNMYVQGDDFEWLNQAYAGWSNPGILLELINNFFRPVVKVLYLINYTLFGTDASMYNLITLAIHLVNVYLIYIFIYKVNRRPGFAALAALCFGVSAMYSEATLWSAGRPESMVFTFMLAAMIPFCGLEEKLSKRQWFMVFLFTLLALGTKETWILLPGLAFGFVWFVKRKTFVQSFRATWPLFLAVVLYLGYFIGIPMITGSAPFTSYAGVGLSQGIYKFSFLMFKYCGFGSIFTGAVWQYALVFVLFGLIVYRLLKTRNMMGFWGLFWMVVTIGITLPIYHAPGRYNYLPLVGFWIFVISFFDYEYKWLQERFKIKKPILILFTALFFGFYTAQQAIMLQWEIRDYHERGVKHKELADMYLAIKENIPVDRPVVFVDLGKRKAVHELHRNIQGYAKILFVRESAIWQQVYLAPLANFLSDPFTRMLTEVPKEEIPAVLEKDFTALVFMDSGFFISTEYPQKVRAYYKEKGQLPFKVQVLRFQETGKVSNQQ